MSAIRIQRVLDSDTLPELRPMTGKTVEITVCETSLAAITPGTGDWAAWPAALSDLDGYDFDAWKTQRESVLQCATWG